MDVSLRQYLEEKFKDIYIRLDRIGQAADREREQVERRLSTLEGDVKVLEKTRPSTAQLLVSLIAGITAATTVATMIIQLVF